MKSHARKYVSSAKRIAARMLRAAADRLHRRTAPDHLLNLFRLLQSVEYKPGLVVDIGAHRGGWTKSALSFFPNASFVLFEPQAELSLALESLQAGHRNIELNIAGVGGADGVFPLTINDQRDDSSSFSVSTQDATARGFAQRQVPVVALDTFFQARDQKPSVVKIDAEGWDLEVLTGGEHTVAGSDLVFIECGVMNKRFANDLGSVIKRMDDLGFRLFDFTDLNRTPTKKALWLVEAVFVRKGGYIDSAITAYD
jgi:FkbM family methyltransferase